MIPTSITRKYISPAKSRYPLAKEILRKRLRSYNAGIIGPRRMRLLGVGIKSPGGRVVGALTGYRVGDWFYISQMWIDRGYRGRGLGTWVVQKAEKEAFKRGCRHAFLETISFQAPGFYSKLGYKPFGSLKNCPEGFSFHCFFKRLRSNKNPAAGSHAPEKRRKALPGFKLFSGGGFEVRKARDLIQKRLDSFNFRKTGRSHYKELWLEVRNKKGRLVGGLSGSTFWGWLQLDLLWADLGARGQGFGKKMILMAESEALKRDSPNVYLKFYSFQSEGFFKKLGYRAFARLRGFPKGYSYCYYFKKLK